MSTEVVPGEVHIANDVLAELAGYAAMESYGVVGMAARSKARQVVELLSRDKLARGVEISTDAKGSVRVHLYVIMEYGVNLAEAAKNLMDRVEHVLTTCAEVDVAGVEVHVQDVKVHK